MKILHAKKWLIYIDIFFFAVIIIFSILINNTSNPLSLFSSHITTASSEEEDYEQDYASIFEKNRLYEAEVIKVIDGDTIQVNVFNSSYKAARVRFNLINTPESVSPDSSKNNKYGRKASKFTKKYLKKGSVVYLQFDKEQVDKYDRLLAYIWLKPISVTDIDLETLRKYCLNAIIIENGYGETFFFNNKLYLNEFQILESEAIKNNIGLWHYKEYRDLTGK